MVGQCEAIVKGDDHEREELKKWMTIGIPIQSKKGEFLGVLGILIQDWIASADNTSLIASFRQLTKCAVEIWENTKNRLETEGLLEGAIHLFSEGYLAIQDGCVITCNKRAESLLLEDPALLNRVIDNLKNLSGSEILFRTSTVQNSFEIKGRVENHIYHLLLNRIRTTEDKTRKQKASIKNIVGTSSIFLKNIKLAELASQMDANVLILGESGTGKELFARAIHRGSSRRDKPFIAINCAAMPRELLNSELFGYVEGAFTGARRGGSPGKFELANGGTLFLDEIGDMPIEQQAALLRVLQEKEVVRIGGSAMIPIDVRIISATNKRLTQEIAYNGSFRSDLYYRLNVFTIELTPLRNRREDIPELVAYFLQELSHTTGLPEKSIDGHAIEAFMRYSWPGNVRELRNVVERSFYLSGYAEIISLKHIPEYVAFRDEIDHHVESARSSDSISKPQEIDRISATPNDLGTQDIKSIRLMKVETEKHEIARILHQNNGNISRCAKELGMSRTTLYRKLKDYNFM
ncbi:sigma 54-interacting transcriptional regulator [Fodinisporobacter ferrooxydans]|uniref:Sigma 54-interacting transcriptional regulator n=1 Tax=Fodinisporobacter ferrooxydans TaxID=2901836 RepID=A0ABY4CIP4_9BACL|nr:sigma 54-interacting transcriptional regulator [Alicyclobacillaceae bacterium MYW30-H2]